MSLGMLAASLGLACSPPEEPPSPTPTPRDDRSALERTPRTGQGLLHDDEDLARWRERATEGPYRSDGDAAPGSPGDWERIRANAEHFAEDPSAAVWSGYPLDRCIEQGDADPPTEAPSQLRDAAFVALVLDDRELAQQVAQTLLQQAAQPGTDATRSEVWCRERLWDVGPSFILAGWGTKLLFAYDYLPDAAFRDGERARIEGWFVAHAEFLRHDLDVALERLFDARPGRGDHVARGVREQPHCGRPVYLNGPRTCSVHRHYNNRRALIAAFVTGVGYATDREDLIRSGHWFVEEFLRFGVFPDGAVADFERWTVDNPSLGWAYGVNSVAAVLLIAELADRAGDPSLYEFTTADGALGSEGGGKSLQDVSRALGRYLDGGYVRFGTDDPERAGDPRYRIDGTDAAGGWTSVHDVSFVLADRGLQDPQVHAVSTRTAPGFAGFPPDPAPNGRHPVWSGPAGTLPGVLFMYAR